MRTVVQEAERTTTASRIVDNFGHHRSILLEEEFVTDTDLTGRLYQHIPQAQVGIQLTEKEHLDLGIGLLLRSIETGGEHLCVVEDEGVILVEVIQDIAEIKVDGIAFLVFQILTVLILLGHLDLPTLTMHNHQSALITMV